MPARLIALLAALPTFALGVAIGTVIASSF